ADGQLDPLPVVGELRVALLGHLHIDAHHVLVVPLVELGQLVFHVARELVADSGTSTLDDDVHKTPFVAWPSSSTASSWCASRSRYAPGCRSLPPLQPQWPQIFLLGVYPV